MKKLATNLFILFLLGNLSARSEGFQEALAKSSTLDDQVETVEYCKLIRDTEAYDRKVVRVRVVMVENHAPRLDGGDSYAFSPHCPETENACLLEAHSTQRNTDSQVLEKLDELQRKRDKHGTSKVWATIVGQFETAKSGFGHLNWAKFRIAVIKIETVEKYKGK